MSISNDLILLLSKIVHQTEVSGTAFTDKGGALIGAGMAMVGAASVGVGQGFASGSAQRAIARNPEVESKIKTFFIVGAAISETSAIYALIIAFLLIFVV